MAFLPWVAMAVSAAGTVSQGIKANQAAEYNAAIAEQNGIAANEQSNARQESFWQGARQRLGAMRAGIAQSGTGFGGSNQLLAKQSLLNAEMDAMNIRYAGELEAKSQFANATNDLYQGKVAQDQGFWGAAGSLARQAGDNYSKTGSIWKSGF